MDLGSLTDRQLLSEIGNNTPGSADELQRRQRTGEYSYGGGSGLSGLVFAIAAVPVVVLFYLAAVLLQGTTWLARESLLAPLFPAPGDSPARFVLAVLTLIVVVPGSALLAARALRATRLRLVARWILIPLAFVLVPVIFGVANAAMNADVVRLPQ